MLHTRPNDDSSVDPLNNVCIEKKMKIVNERGKTPLKHEYKLFIAVNKEKSLNLCKLYQGEKQNITYDFGNISSMGIYSITTNERNRHLYQMTFYRLFWA